MARQRPTPEEDLLNLIEKGDAAGAAGFKRKRGFFLGLSSLKSSWLSLGSGINRGLSGFKSGLREPNLKVLNKVFLVISLVLLTYSIMDFAFSRPNIEKVYRKSRLVKEREPLRKPAEELRPFLHYLEVVRRRNIFSPILLKEAEKPEVKKKRVQEMAKDLSLVGISWDDREPVAMIEDKKEKKTEHKQMGKYNGRDVELLIKTQPNAAGGWDTQVHVPVGILSATANKPGG